MKSEIIGAGISNPEILNVSPHGFWLGFEGREYFLDFKNFPWFASARLEDLFLVEVVHGQHLYWPKLDIDLDLDRIINPDKYPLVAKT